MCIRDSNYGLRSREPGNYGLNTSLQPGLEAPATYNRDYKLPGLGGIPGEDQRRTTLHNGTGVSAARSSSTLPTHSSLTSGQFEALIPDSVRGKRSVPPNVALNTSPPGLVTESVTKTTFTETTVT